MDEEKLDKRKDELEDEKNTLVKPLKLTKKNKMGIKIESQRFTSPTKRYSSSTSVCTRDGKLTRIYTSFNNYNRTTKIVKVYPGCFYIKSKYNKNGHSVLVFKVDKIDNKTKTIYLNKIASFRNNKWDNKDVLPIIKSAITSTVNKAKKYYYFTNID